MGYLVKNLYRFIIKQIVEWLRPNVSKNSSKSLNHFSSWPSFAAILIIFVLMVFSIFSLCLNYCHGFTGICCFLKPFGIILKSFSVFGFCNSNPKKEFLKIREVASLTKTIIASFLGNKLSLCCYKAFDTQKLCILKNV